MKKLTPNQQKEHAEILAKLRDYDQAGHELVSDYNDTLDEMYKDFEKSLEELGTKLMEDMANKLDVGVFEQAASFASEVRDAASDFFEQRSEKWQEGEKGQEYQSFLDEWDNASCEIDDPQDDVEPDELFDGATYAHWEAVELDEFENVTMGVE